MGIFIGYSTISKAYRIWDPEKKIVFRSRDVKFSEEFFENLNRDGSLNEATSENKKYEIEIEFFENKSLGRISIKNSIDECGFSSGAQLVIVNVWF